MKTNTALPRWGQWAAGLTLTGAAIAAGATSLTLNVLYGWQIGPAAAVTFGLADLAKITIPIVCVAIGWTWQSRLTLVLCAIVSLTCAASYFADREAGPLLARETRSAVYTGAQADMVRARTELASIHETGDAKALAAAANLAQAQAKAEAANGGCRKRCLAASAEATVLLERLGKAKRRDALQAQLADAKQEASRSAGNRSTGRGLMLAAATGGNAFSIEKWLAGAMSVLKIALLETLVYLSIPGATLLGQALSAKSPKAAAATAKQPKNTPPSPRGSKPQAKSDDNKVVALRPDTVAITRMATRGMTQQQIADVLGVSRSTVQRRLSEARGQSQEAQTVKQAAAM
ncbi:MAG: helix-turn-helix domain-containing protein [Alphaproteobacteria bacterium]